MAVSRFFWKTAGGAFLAQQRHAVGHTATLAAAEHGDLEAHFAVTDGNGAGVAMVAMHGQATMVSDGLVVIQGLLEGGLQLCEELGFQVVQQPHSGSSPVGG